MNYKKILIATKNKGKLKEFKSFLTDLKLKILSLDDVNITQDVIEDGKTYTDNSQKKAVFYAKLSGLPTISDDGGLEIDALNGQPGINSRRWLGYEATDEVLTEHLTKVSKTLPDDNRKAKFITVVSFTLPNGKVWSKTGEIIGEIAKVPLVNIVKGYPYRSFFYLPELQKYYHEDDLTTADEKLYNHRYKALKKLIPIIKKEL